MVPIIAREEREERIAKGEPVEGDLPSDILEVPDMPVAEPVPAAAVSGAEATVADVLPEGLS